MSEFSYIDPVPLFPSVTLFFLIRTMPWFIECSRHNALLTLAHARTKYSSVFSTPDRTRRKRERRSGRLLFGENYPRTAKHIHLRYSTGCSTSGANKSRANKSVPAPRAAGSGIHRGGPNFCAREQILEPRRPGTCRACQNTRAHSIKIHHRGRKRSAPGFFSVGDRKCLSSPLMHARQVIRVVRRVWMLLSLLVKQNLSNFQQVYFSR